MLRNLRKNSLIAAIVLVALAGCKKQDAATTAPAGAGGAAKAAVQKRQSSVAAAVAPVTVAEPNFINKKDPFKPFVVAKPATPSALPGGRGAGLSRGGGMPLQSYELSQFKVIGIVASGQETKAMVVDPAGKAYVVKPGMAIGKNDGQVLRVTSAGIEVQESYQDDNGRLKKRITRMSLPRKD